MEESAEKLRALVKAYIDARSTMLDCQAKEHVYDCYGCSKHHKDNGKQVTVCEARLAWINGYNEMNRVASAESATHYLPDYRTMAKRIDDEDRS